MSLLAHITSAEGPGIVTLLLIGVVAGVVLGLTIATIRSHRRD